MSLAVTVRLDAEEDSPLGMGGGVKVDITGDGLVAFLTSPVHPATDTASTIAATNTTKKCFFIHILSNRAFFLLEEVLLDDKTLSIFDLRVCRIVTQEILEFSHVFVCSV